MVDGFRDSNDDGVVGYGGKLNIRPAFQREFAYKEKQQKDVIYSIFKGFPLNVMYWVDNNDGTYDLLDGQQRTLSICSYHNDEFFANIDGKIKGFSNLTPSQVEQFLNYELQIYICQNGTTEEKLDWFKIINIAGETLNNQELLNAVYTGKWITEAKRKFSKNKCVAQQLGSDYMKGTPIRQDYLETVLGWCAHRDGVGSIEEYMAIHQNDDNADREWQYFQFVIQWVTNLFPTYRSEMKGIAWGELYNKFKDDYFSAKDLETEIKRLMEDDDVTNKKGIYHYALSRDEKKLNIRNFSQAMKRSAYERQGGICPGCGHHFDMDEMEGDHIKPWSEGGKTTAENCQMLCKNCNRSKSNK